MMKMKSAEEYLKQPYSRILIPDENGGYSAEILEFPGCFSQGDTPDEAYRNLEEAAHNWVQSALDQGLEIPPPFANQGYSGRVALRLPKSLHTQAMKMARHDGVSLNQFIVSAVAEKVGAENLYGRMIYQLDKRIEQFSSTGTWLGSFSIQRWEQVQSSAGLLYTYLLTGSESRKRIRTSWITSPERRGVSTAGKVLWKPFGTTLEANQNG